MPEQLKVVCRGRVLDNKLHVVPKDAASMIHGQGTYTFVLNANPPLKSPPIVLVTSAGKSGDVQWTNLFVRDYKNDGFIVLGAHGAP